MPLKREGISFSFFSVTTQLWNHFVDLKKSIVIFHAKTIFIVTLVENQPKKNGPKNIVLKRWKLMMLLAEDERFYWRKRKRSFCHLINGILMIADSQLTRKAPASYSDGVYRMSGHSRPSPRSISQQLMKGSDGLASRRNRTALHTFFGEFFIVSWIIIIFEVRSLIVLYYTREGRCLPLDG